MFPTARTALALLLLAALALPHPALADGGEPAAAIERAVLNYANAIYHVEPGLIRESVSPKLQKVGYMPARDGSGLVEDWMDFEQLEELAGHINKGGRFDPETAPREIRILDHTDTIANVKLVAAWGVDYIHLSRHSGKWMIMNVIWEMPSE